MKLVIASGKGGTGKTTLSVNLASVLDFPVQLLDCDVEEPNDHLFLKGIGIREEVITRPVPQVDESLCDGCGECGRFCEYNAIVSFGTKPLVFPEMCHSCGGCIKVCPRHAIHETARRIGVILSSQVGKISTIQGCLDVGISMAPPLIRAVKARMQKNVPAILDAPPGTSCPVTTTLQGADYALLITEPTPFGLHDLTLAVETVREFPIPFGIVINRAGIGDHRVQEYCRRDKIPILLEIPEDRAIAEAYSRGRLIVEALPQYTSLFRDLAQKVGLMGENA